jgi:peptidoglycan hydrolase-like protein with peptidoglycan-binding domain
MRQRNVLLAGIILIGSCVVVSPTWSQTSKQTQPGDTPVADKKTDRQDQEKVKEGKQTSGQSDPMAKTQQTQPGDTPVADKQDKSMRQSSGESSTMDRRTARVDVKKIQEALKDKGNDPGEIDGKMGPKTREALKSFQTANNLPATGRIDNETAKQLGVEAKGSSTSR